MIKALCSCGFCGNLDDLKVTGNGGTNGRNILICPECESSEGLDFVGDGSELIKVAKDSHSKNIDEENLTTKGAFELFKKCVMYWIKHFGLYGWDIRLLHQEDEDSLAYTKFNVLNRSASIVLSKNWGDRIVTDIEIDKSAFHEVCELLMMRVRFAEEARFVSTEKMGEEIHTIIRTMEHLIWEPKLRDLSDRIKKASKIVEDVVEKNIIRIRNNILKT